MCEVMISDSIINQVKGLPTLLMWIMILVLLLQPSFGCCAAVSLSKPGLPLQSVSALRIMHPSN
jgi:hypothetical protein